MNHKMNLKIGLISALLLGQSLANAAPASLRATKFGSHLTAMDTKTQPVEITPIRKGKGTIRIDRVETTWDATLKAPVMNLTHVCTKTYEARVFDVRNSPKNYYTTPDTVTCTDVVMGAPVEIRAGSSLYLVERLADGMPNVKVHSAFAYLLDSANRAPAIPFIRNQDSFTIDLNQVHFGAISLADSRIMCKAESQPIGPMPEPIPGPTPRLMSTLPEPADPTPLPPPNQPDCTVFNPITYQAIWTAEDQP